jgi:hypothetical protein
MTHIERLALSRLKPWPRNARIHSRMQVKQLAESIQKFGFTQPVLIDEDNYILAGHGRVNAAAQLDYAEVPCIRIAHLNEAQKRAYVVADNKLALNSGWDRKILAEELNDLRFMEDVSFDVDVTGFSLTERDKLGITGPIDAKTDPRDGAGVPARCRPGDIFKLGRHWLICSDELRSSTLHWLEKGEQHRMLIAVPRDEDSGKPVAEIAPDWYRDALYNVENAGGVLFMSDSDPARCDRIIDSWEKRTQDSAVWFDEEPLDEDDVDFAEYQDNIAKPEVSA